jgi:hypothetical protein
MIKLSTRRGFGKRSFAAAMGMTAAVAMGRQTSFAADTADLQSEFLFDLALTTQPPAEIGAGLTVVAVASGTFDGPKMKGTVIGPAGDWIVQRHDGSRLLDVRALLQTDDGQRVYMNWRGIAYTPPGGKLYARILPMFVTDAAKYIWLNNVAAVGVYRPTAGKILYRVYEIL